MLLLAAALAVVPPTPDWMGSLYAERPDTKLSSLVIPGTHDSGAFKIDTSGKCKVVPIAGLSPIQAAVAKSNPCAAGKLSKAQSQNFTGQLNGGIRYLDMRLGVPQPKVLTPKKIPKKLSNAKAAKVPIVMQHSYVSIRFTKALDQIVTFAKAHPREQIILDFQHIDLTGKKKVDKYYSSAIDKILRSSRVKPSCNVISSRISKKCTNNKGETHQVLTFRRLVPVLYASITKHEHPCKNHANSSNTNCSSQNYCIRH